MNPNQMREKIDRVIADMELRQLEDRIAPIKCEKNPEAPECQPAVRYGITPDDGSDEPVVRYGIGF